MTDATIATAPALRMNQISKSFPGVNALTQVDLLVRTGCIHAVVGENGAGKSTLMKILAGVYEPDGGTIEVNGEPTVLATPLDAQRLGIRMVYQELNLVPDLTVAENISLGQMKQKFGLVDKKAMRSEAEQVLADLGARIDVSELVGNLTVSQQQLIEIAKAYLADPRIIVLDEPTSSLSEHEAQVLFTVIRRMRDKGIAVIYISHRLREVLDIAEDVTVLRDGRQIDSRLVAGLTPHDMIHMMVGRELTDMFPKRDVPIGEVALSVTGLTRTSVFEDISFTVRRGEIVGLAGLVGSGRTEVARALFGLDRKDSGQVLIGGREAKIRRPRDAVRHGIGYVPEDRKADGIVPAMSIKENLTLAIIAKLAKFGLIKSRTERTLAESYVDRLGISPRDPDRRMDTLSGGNQQKVSLGKWLAADPSVLILDEPTRGVDVGAKADIHTLIGELVAQGVGILMISSELPEILAVSDRIYVLHEGTLTAEFSRAEASEQSVMAAATGEVAA